MVKIGTINAFPGSQLNDYSTNNTVVINPDKEDHQPENQTGDKAAPRLKINEDERAIRDFVRVINALAEAKPKFFLKNGRFLHRKFLGSPGDCHASLRWLAMTRLFFCASLVL